jgi:hypothetical protein
MTASPLVTQTLVCLVILGLMVLSAVKKRRLELRTAPPSLPRLLDRLRNRFR